MVFVLFWVILNSCSSSIFRLESFSKLYSCAIRASVGFVYYIVGITDVWARNSFKPEPRVLVSENDLAADKGKKISMFIFNMQEMTRDRRDCKGQLEASIGNSYYLFVLQWKGVSYLAYVSCRLGVED